jgi:NYN domain
MLFVDGENLTIRAQDLAKEAEIKLTDPTRYRQDTFVWFPGFRGLELHYLINGFPSYKTAIRAYYYTSLVGATDKIDSVRQQLRALYFEPHVFKKTTGHMKSKGVDVTLTKDMLAHAFQDHYDAAVLFAGDGDYVPLIEEVKRRGKNVVVCFFEGRGLAEEMKLTADYFFDLTKPFIDRWRPAGG